MCTVTWVHEPDGYQLLCNRDEKRTRAQALPPRAVLRNGVRFLAPVDGDFDGTWIGTNEFGVSICLLNGEGSGTPRRSRGLLLIDLLTEESAAKVSARLSECDLSPYAPFTIVTLEPGHEASVLRWNGVEKTVSPCPDAYLPLTSSSVDPQGVEARRRAEFQRRLKTCGRLNANLLFEFHENHGPRANAYSTCMHRPDAQTVSFSWVKVTGSEAEFFYTPAAPCSWTPGESHKLRLRR